jgi:hypothetical protein
MNSTLTSERSLDRDVQPVLASTLRSSLRLSMVDRLSLRLGLWLLVRSTRRLQSAHDVEAHRVARAAQRACEARDALTLHHHTRAYRA